MPDEHHLTLTEGLHAPAHARAWLSERLATAPQTVIQDALLVASELVTNAVRHGLPEIVLSLGIGFDRVRIAVRDCGTTLPQVPSGPPSLERPSGRGLLIVAATATDWGVEPHAGGGGKTVWVELALA